MIALLAMACAATWSPGEPLPADGVVVLPGGDALRLRVEPAGALVEVTDPLGAEVAVWGVPEGLLLPAEPLGRTLILRPEPGAQVLVFREDNRAVLRAWERWQSAAWRAMRRDEPIPQPPSGGARLAAELNLREQALDDLGVRTLGLMASTAPYAPISSVSHRVPGARGALEKPGESTRAVTMRGPGVALIHTWPEPEGTLTRYTVSPTLDGVALPSHALASTGAAARTVRVWVPPGEHALSAAMDAGVVDFQLAPLRPAVGMPRMARCGRDGGLAPADAAELAWICGDLPRALDGYRPLRDGIDAVSTLALVRLLELETDPERHAGDIALASARLNDPQLGEEAREVLANALLSLAPELPDATVLAALAAAQDPNPAALSQWLDAQGGLRPGGLALLDMARPAIPNQDVLGRLLVLEAGLATRLTLLDPEGSPEGVHLRSARGPGVPRVLLTAGQSAEIHLDPSFPGRVPVLRLRAESPVRFTLDGQALASMGGPLDLALAPGVYVLNVEEGELLLPDPEGVVGGERVYERAAAPLPATWTLPDPGVPSELRVELINAPGDCAVLARFDTGELRCATAVMRAPAAARSLTLEGPGYASVGMRVHLGEAPPPPLTPVADLDAALAALSALTRRIDAGDASARLERATLLARLGSLELARQDLAVAARNPALIDRSAALAPRLIPPRPSAPSLGLPAPRTPEAALALAGDAGPPTAPHLAALGLPYTLAQAAALWEEDDPMRALAAALDAGPAGAEVAARLESRLVWTPITRAERGGGLVELEVPLPAPESVPGRIRAALLSQPWPTDEGLVARGSLGVLSRFQGQSLDLRLFCRDERLEGKPCTVALRLDAERSVYTIGDGQTLDLLFALPPGVHELELMPGERAIALRAEVDGALLPPTVPRLALRVSPETPAELAVAAPSVVRVDCLRGQLEAKAGGRTLHLAAGEHGLLPQSGDGSAALQVTGDGDVLLWWGVFEERSVAAPPVLPALQPPPGPDPALRDAVLRRFAHPAVDPGVLPGGPASVQLGLSPQLGRIGTSAELWRSEQLFAEVLRADSRSWQRAELWFNGPDWALQSWSQRAGGVELEAGRAWPDAWAGVRLGAAAGSRSQYQAGSARLVGFAVRDINLGPTVELRGAARARASVATAPPGPVRVDPEAWNERIAESPIEGALTASLIVRPARDLRLELGVQGDGRVSSGPSPWVLSPGVYGELNLLVGDMGCATLNATLDGAIAGDLSGLPPSGPRLGAAYDHVLWAGPTRRWVVWGEATAWPGPGVAEGAIGVRLLLTPRRGVEDLPPYRELFLTHRGGP